MQTAWAVAASLGPWTLPLPAQVGPGPGPDPLLTSDHPQPWPGSALQSLNYPLTSDLPIPLTYFLNL